MVKNALNQSTAAGAATKVNDKMRPNKKKKQKNGPIYLSRATWKISSSLVEM